MTTTNELKVLTTLPPDTSMFPDKNSTYSYQPTVEQENVEAGVQVDSTSKPTICQTEPASMINTLTLLDSGASDYCFSD